MIANSLTNGVISYEFNGLYGNYNLGNGTFIFNNIDSNYPIAFLNKNNNAGSNVEDVFTYTGQTDNDGNLLNSVDEGIHSVDGVDYQFWSGTVVVNVFSDFNNISYTSYNKNDNTIHHAGGTNNLYFNINNSYNRDVILQPIDDITIENYDFISDILLIATDLDNDFIDFSVSNVSGDTSFINYELKQRTLTITQIDFNITLGLNKSIDFTITADDNNGSTDSKTFNLTINNTYNSFYYTNTNTGIYAPIIYSFINNKSFINFIRYTYNVYSIDKEDASMSQNCNLDYTENYDLELNSVCLITTHFIILKCEKSKAYNYFHRFYPSNDKFGIFTSFCKRY